VEFDLQDFEIPGLFGMQNVTGISVSVMALNGVVLIAVIGT
jgi:hypothetical protein